MSLLQELDWLPDDEVARRLQGLATSPQSAQRDVEIALLLLSRGRFEDAAKYGEAAFALAPQERLAAYVCGVTRIQRAQWQPALDALLQLPVDFERAGEVAVFCALALLELGRAEEAERVAAAPSGVDDETHGTLCALRGRAAMGLGDPARAAALFDEALAYAPKLDWARTLRGRLPRAGASADVVTIVI